MSNTINNPVTGERIKFLEHPGEIDLLAMEFTIAPQGFVAAPHVHDQPGHALDHVHLPWDENGPEHAAILAKSRASVKDPAPM